MLKNVFLDIGPFINLFDKPFFNIVNPVLKDSSIKKLDFFDIFSNFLLNLKLMLIRFIELLFRFESKILFI